MKALTISQPFASLIANGEKWVENRFWSTSYRGPLAIHAGKGTQYLDRRELEDYPTSCIVAVANLCACMPLHTIHRIPRRQVVGCVGKTAGDILDHKHTEGPWCWVLKDVEAIEPVHCRGAQGLWEPPADVLATLLMAISERTL
jgi:activating signal cointegrator 1